MDTLESGFSRPIPKQTNFFVISCIKCKKIFTDRGLECIGLAQHDVEAYFTNYMENDAVLEIINDTGDKKEMLKIMASREMKSLSYYAYKLNLLPDELCSCFVCNFVCSGCGSNLGYFTWNPCTKCFIRTGFSNQLKHIWVVFKENVMVVGTNQPHGVCKYVYNSRIAQILNIMNQNDIICSQLRYNHQTNNFVNAGITDMIYRKEIDEDTISRNLQNTEVEQVGYKNNGDLCIIYNTNYEFQRRNAINSELYSIDSTLIDNQLSQVYGNTNSFWVNRRVPTLALLRWLNVRL
ncbi:hypothetical protein BB559_007163 [Furculomyces boomerangus]|uniref:Uncharacterized protein n=1 Tax=Furculomyces boomerangus TaxID=61424 RepID=A0A2T9XYN8_9FUNG|nr:hypothetical protein BB559_007163 [Furculomyces boomerangus]